MQKLKIPLIHLKQPLTSELQSVVATICYDKSRLPRDRLIAF